MKDITNQLRAIADKAAFENTKYVYLKTPVKVGSNPNGDVFCNYFYWHENPFYGDDYIVIHVLFDEVPSDLYSRSFNFTLIAYNDEESFVPDIIDNEKNLNLVIQPDALPTILAAALECGNDWIEYQKNLQIRSRYFQRRCGGKDMPKFTWDEKLERMRIHIELNWLSNWHTYDGDQKTLDQMLTMGEEAYTKMIDEQTERMRPMMEEIMAEILAKPENDWLND